MIPTELLRAVWDSGWFPIGQELRVWKRIEADEWYGGRIPFSEEVEEQQTSHIRDILA